MLQIQQEKGLFYPEQASVYLETARILQDLADLTRLMAYHEALRHLERGIENTGPDSPAELLYETARLRYSVGQYEKAIELTNTILNKEPDHALALKLRDMILKEQTARQVSANRGGNQG
jgi:tetratricopeptide (TPR) repeat protein